MKKVIKRVPVVAAIADVDTAIVARTARVVFNFDIFALLIMIRLADLNFSQLLIEQ